MPQPAACVQPRDDVNDDDISVMAAAGMMRHGQRCGLYSFQSWLANAWPVEMLYTDKLSL